MRKNISDQIFIIWYEFEGDKMIHIIFSNLSGAEHYISNKPKDVRDRFSIEERYLYSYYEK